MHLFSKCQINAMCDAIKHLTSDKSRIPDHSIIVWDVFISDYACDTNLPVKPYDIANKSHKLSDVVNIKFNYLPDIYTHTHTHIYIYMCVCMCIYIWEIIKLDIDYIR